MSKTDAIKKALDVAMLFGSIDGDHHRAWVIDQMVRALTETDAAYKRWVSAACDGEEGPHTYEWDVGIPP